MMESFWGTMQLELLDARTWQTRDELVNAIFEWIECWYNPKRRHSSIGMHSPITFEALHTPVRPRSLTSHPRCPAFGGNLKTAKHEGPGDVALRRCAWYQVYPLLVVSGLRCAPWASPRRCGSSSRSSRSWSARRC